MDKNKLNSCLNLAKKMPPSNLVETTSNISQFLLKNNETYSEFLQKMDKPLSVCRDDSLGDFIKSEFNTEGDSFRSPWSNKYFPEIEIPKYPPNELRELEVILNKLFKEYSKLYYGDKAVSSVYVWEQGDSIENGLCCAILIKNSASGIRNLSEGEWHAINVVNIKFSKEKDKNIERIKATYKLTSSVIFKMKMNHVGVELSGNFSKYTEESHFLKSYLDYEVHLEKIGKMVESAENNIRNGVDEIYIKKSNEIINKLRHTHNSTSVKINSPDNLFNLFNNR